jgi:hypothetical protein
MKRERVAKSIGEYARIVRGCACEVWGKRNGKEVSLQSC